MHTLITQNVNDALPRALDLLARSGVQRQCRPNSAGSTVVEVPGPVATTYLAPRQRVLWDPLRDANPFFHFFEALWILAGRDDVAFLAHFNKRMADFSDDGQRFHAPYGHRLRHASHDGGDQVQAAIDMLRADHNTRQVVLQIWDHARDLNWGGKDIPCNDMVFLKIRDHALHMTVCCRSNDAVWGAYGANAVQFSMLQDYIAAHVGVDVGPYTQLSDSLHVYTDNPYWQAYRQARPHGGMWLRATDLYELQDGTAPVVYPLFKDTQQFDADLATFFNMWDLSYDPSESLVYHWTTAAFMDVVLPLYRAHLLHKMGDTERAIDYLSRHPMHNVDWLQAACTWLTRRALKERAARLGVD
jgi:hypothetical protein